MMRTYKEVNDAISIVMHKVIADSLINSIARPLKELDMDLEYTI